ncbi:MAG: hypothetical protein Q8P67_13610, partial [archaeon]|nr:hypothetical protein [archaeon]
ASPDSPASSSASAPAPKRPAVSFAAAALAAQFGAKLRRRARDSNADSSPSRAAVATPRSLQTPFSFVDKSQALTQKEKKRAPARLFRPKSAPPLASLAIVFAIALGLLGVFFLLEWDSTPGSHEVAPFRTIAAGSGVVDLSGSKLTVSLSHHADPRDDRFCNDFEIVDEKGEVLGHIVRSEQGPSYGFHLLDTQLRLNASMTGSAALLRNEVEFVVMDANGTFLAKIDEHWRPGFFLSEYWVELKDQRNSVFAFISKGDADRNEMDFLTEESLPPLFHMRRSITHFLIFSKSEYRWEIQRVGQQRVVDPRITALFAAKLIATNLIDEDHDDDDSTMSSQTHVDDDLDILPSADQVDDWDM